MVVHYGPTNISGLEKELRKLGSFHFPSGREMRAMEVLYEEYKKTNKNNGTPIKKILQSLHIPNGQDLGTLNDSRYLEKGMMSMNEILKLSSDGIRYMDYFYGLWLRKYEDKGGAIKNGYMENSAKREEARQWAKERMEEIVNGIPHTVQIREQGVKKEEEVFKLSPEFYGIGVNLKAFWRRICRDRNYSILGIVFILVGTFITAIPLLDAKKNINDDYILQMNQQTGEYTQNKNLTDRGLGWFGLLFIVSGTVIEVYEKMAGKKAQKYVRKNRCSTKSEILTKKV